MPSKLSILNELKHLKSLTRRCRDLIRGHSKPADENELHHTIHQIHERLRIACNTMEEELR